MMRLFFLSTITLLLSSHSPLLAKSSAIPDRREFPVNRDISPCQDFYKYACSNAMDAFELREDRSRHIFSFSDSAERLLEAKKKFLKDLQSQSENKLSQRSRSLKRIYAACMNESASKEEEKQNIARIVTTLNELKTRESFVKFVGSQIDSPEYSFIRYGSDSNLTDPSRRDLMLLADLQTLPERSYYSQKPVTDDLEQVVKATLVAMQWPEAEKRAREIVEFEKRFSKTYPTPADFRELMVKKTQIQREKLLKKFPSFELSAFLEKVPSTTLIRDLTPKNFEFVENALKRKTSIP